MKISLRLYRYLILLCISIPHLGFGQNLIYNGSFELNVCPNQSGTGNPNLGGAMVTESGWLNVHDLNLTCSNFCSPAYNSGFNYGVIYGDTAITPCCGKGCAHGSTSSSKFHKDYIIKGFLSYDTAKMRTSSYIAQKLGKPLIVNHRYLYYMFYTYYRVASQPPPDPYKLVPWFDGITRKIPNISHDGFGVAFSTYFNKFSKSYPFSPTKQDVLPTTPEQRKLRFVTSYVPYWRKLQGTFRADSAYSYITIGNFWRTSEINFNPPLKQMSATVNLIYLDSINLWDVTHRIIADSQYCKGQKTVLHTQNYNKGNTVWYDANYTMLGSGDSLKLTVTQDSLIKSIRFFPEPGGYITTDSIWLRIKNEQPVFKLERVGDTCKLPASFKALPLNLSYTWNGISNGTNSYTTNISGDVLIVATDSNKCINSAKYEVQPEVKFSISLISDTCLETSVLEFKPTNYKYFYKENPISNPYKTDLKGNIFIIGEHTNGCKDTAYFLIPICKLLNDEIWIPNAFTPDNNNLNDLFAPVGEFIKSYQLTIFNRWGEKIFLSETGQSAWDGNYKGKPVPDGVYFYQLSIELINSHKIWKSGTITLLR